MKIKNIIQLLFLTTILCIMFCGCGKENSDKKTTDNIASSTDSVIENTDIAESDSSESSEIIVSESTTDNSANGGIETESSSANKDDNTTDNIMSNDGGSSSTTSTEAPTTQPSGVDNGSNSGNVSTTTEDTIPEENTYDWYIYMYGHPTGDCLYEEYCKSQQENTTEVITNTTTNTETVSVENCTHPWDKRKWGGYMDVHYEGVYEEQLVCVQAAYDEKVYAYHNFCNGCGADLDLLAVELGYGEIDGGATPGRIGHACYWSEAWQEYTYASYHCAKTVVNTIHHEAVYEMQDVCISPEWGIIYAIEICNVCGGEVKNEHSTYYGEESDFAWYNDPYIPQ